MTYTIYRLYRAFLVSYRYTQKVFYCAIVSKETATFTYNLTPENEVYLMNLIAQIAKTDIKLVEGYFNELKGNAELRKTILYHIVRSPLKKKKDRRCDYGNKLGLYAIIRILKPALVVENGIEAGFTSIVLCEAIRKNISEGYNGRFIGLDINKEAGYLIKVISEYSNISELKYGDAIESLRSIDDRIGFYFSDGLRSYQYEQAEFACLENKLDNKAVVITNKATFSKALFEFSRQLNKSYSFFKEQPLGHWYEGAGIGIMYS